MSLEVGLLKVGGSIANACGKLWLADRKAKATRESSLAELAGARGLGVLPQRRLDRQLAQLAETIAEKLSGYASGELSSVPENERVAALLAVAKAFGKIDLSDRALFGADVTVAGIEQLLAGPAQAALATAYLSESATRYFERVLRESIAYFADVVVSLPSFEGRALRELLTRESAVIDSLREILDRMPQRSGTHHRQATEVEFDYLREVARKLDVVELFGLTSVSPTRRLPLTVAYIGLTALYRSGHGTTPYDREDVDVTRANDEKGVELVLSQNPRLLVRGEAGSGKTTLLRWLAVNSARGTFAPPLQRWNDLVPFFVQLRRYSDRPLPGAEEINAGIGWQIMGDKPQGWISAILRAGRGLVLIDGIDELPENRRRDVHAWVEDLVSMYPGCRYVLTSRSPAVSRKWLSNVGFRHAELQAMSPGHVNLFIRHWHEAAAQDEPDEEQQDLEVLRGRLTASIDASLALKSLATNPLLCALLCALNRERRSRLPTRRIDIYRTALDMLLSKRDSGRDVADELADQLTIEDKLQLLADLAYWYTETGLVVAERSRVLNQIRLSLRNFTGRRLTAEQVYDHLLLRTGVLREPAVDRVDFLHKTFQEFLCARKIIESDAGEKLIARIRQKSYREVIVMALGQARPAEQNRLFEKLLDKVAAPQTDDARKALKLFVVRCLETAHRLAPEVYAKALEEIREVVPPRTLDEARALAVSGPDALRFLPVDGLRADEAVASIRTAALVGGPEALDLIGVLSERHSFASIGDELVSVWPFFDPIEYSRRVFKSAPTNSWTLVVNDLAILPGIEKSPFSAVVCEFGSAAKRADFASAARLATLSGVRLTECAVVSDFAWLDGCSTAVAEVRAIRCKNLRDVSALRSMRSLARLSLVDTAPATDFSVVADLKELSELEIGPIDHVTSAHLVASLRRLKALRLCSSIGLISVADLGSHRLLRRLVLDDCNSLAQIGDLSGFPQLDSLCISECPGLLELAAIRSAHQIRSLQLHWCDSLVTLNGLVNFIGLEELSLIGLRGLTDLSVLGALTNLRRLRIRDCPKVQNLSPLAEMSQLRLLDTAGSGVQPTQRFLAQNPNLRVVDNSTANSGYDSVENWLYDNEIGV
ncbi:NACHT domain-containing protein [Amycolatopsis sp. H6(2020)]|nr:NACHT domain-containing protein [Amycolatopsis sp. H6(2020)]